MSLNDRAFKVAELHPRLNRPRRRSRQHHDVKPHIDKPAIRAAVRVILEAIGENPNREGLIDTPDRVAEMYAELFSGIHFDPARELEVLFDANHGELVLLRDIPFFSMCEHHLTPFGGRAHVAYIPNEAGEVPGLSKIARALDVLSKRLQLQERLTTQVAEAMEAALTPRGVLVVIEAEHLCMTMRGIRKPGTQTVTSAVRGLFATNDATRAEAMAMIFRQRS